MMVYFVGFVVNRSGQEQCVSSAIENSLVTEDSLMKSMSPTLKPPRVLHEVLRCHSDPDNGIAGEGEGLICRVFSEPGETKNGYSPCIRQEMEWDHECSGT
jgi:hypothetical protein